MPNPPLEVRLEPAETSTEETPQEESLNNYPLVSHEERGLEPEQMTKAELELGWTTETMAEADPTEPMGLPEPTTLSRRRRP